MAPSFNSVLGFNSTVSLKVQAHCPHASRNSSTSTIRFPHLPGSSGLNGPLSPAKRMRLGFCVLVANGDQFVTDTNSKDFKHVEKSYSDEGSISVNPPPSESSIINDGIQPKAADGSGPQFSGLSKSSMDSGSSKEDALSANQKPYLKRSPLTAREKLRAARVLSRYTESKASKPAIGSKLLDTLRESDKGKKRSGLPEAPTNLFDDSKRGMPKPGWTFEFPGGADMFLIAFSFVFISTVMFATTYIVWKVGAIHFNEY